MSIDQETNVALLAVKGKPDAEKAKDFKDRLRPFLESVCTILAEAQRDGIVLQFNLGADMYGRQTITNLSATKPL